MPRPRETSKIGTMYFHSKDEPVPQLWSIETFHVAGDTGIGTLLNIDFGGNHVAHRIGYNPERQASQAGDFISNWHHRYKN